MKNLLAFLSIFFVLEAKADIGSQDVVEIRYNGEYYYTKVHSIGLLKNNDLCYYSYSGDYLSEMIDHLGDDLGNRDSISIFSEMISIEMSRIDNRYFDFQELYFFRDEKKIPIEELKNFDLVGAFNGNTYGFELYPRFSKLKFDWIKDYEVERLFTLGEGEMCSYYFYTIKSNFTKSEILEIQKILSTCRTTEEAAKINRLREKLYNMNVFMIKFCSC